MENKSIIQLWKIFFIYSWIIIVLLALLWSSLDLWDTGWKLCFIAYFLLLVISIIHNFFDWKWKIQTNYVNQGVFTLIISMIFVISVIIPISGIYLREENYEILFIVLMASWLISVLCFNHLQKINNHKNENTVLLLKKERHHVKNLKIRKLPTNSIKIVQNEEPETFHRKIKSTEIKILENRKICKRIGFTEFKIPEDIDEIFDIESFLGLIYEFNLQVFFWLLEDNTCNYIILSFGEYPDKKIDDYAEDIPEAIRLLKREPKLEYESWDSYNERKKDAQKILLKNMNSLINELRDNSIFTGNIFTMPSSKSLIQDIFKEIWMKLDFRESKTRKQIECTNFADSCENASKKMHFMEHNKPGNNCIIVDDILWWWWSSTHVNRHVGKRPNLFIFFAHDKKNR